MTKLLVSIRGANEAEEAARGGAQIIDVEFPASALGTPYPLNLLAVQDRLTKIRLKRSVVTNIGEKQLNWSSSCQAALGVAKAGVSAVKCGLAELELSEALKLGDSLVRTVKHWYPNTQVVPAVFADRRLAKLLDPLTDGIDLAKQIKADGLLIDTYNKKLGKGLLDYYTLTELKKWISELHKSGIEAWLAGSIQKGQLRGLAKIGADVICVRKAACEPLSGKGRFGEVKREIVKDLVSQLS